MSWVVLACQLAALYRTPQVKTVGTEQVMAQVSFESIAAHKTERDILASAHDCLVLCGKIPDAKTDPETMEMLLSYAQHYAPRLSPREQQRYCKSLWALEYLIGHLNDYLPPS